MNLLLITDAFPPLRTSGAELAHSLTQELLMKNHQVFVITPSSDLNSSVSIERVNGYIHVRVKALKTKDMSYLRRTLAEWVNPYIMKWHLSKNSIFMEQSYDGVIWYSPTIFWGPLVSFLKNQFKCPSYLVLRDFFPDWAMHLNLLSQHGIPYKFFKLIERYQYQLANVIGVQSPNNVEYFRKNNPTIHSRLEVLWNWTSTKNSSLQLRESSLRLDSTVLRNKTVFVYAGNMGVAQGLNSLIELITFFANDPTVGFLIIGRGSEMGNLRKRVQLEGWQNVIFHDEVPFEKISGIIQQCHIGLIFLDERHRTHNIPGKLTAYLEAGIPVLAKVNIGNDLLEIIPAASLGQVWAANSGSSFEEAALEVLQSARNLLDAQDVRSFLKSRFSVENAASQICKSFQTSE